MADERLKRKIQARAINVEAFSLRLNRFLSNRLESLTERLQDGEPEAFEAAQILGSLQTELVRGGLEEVTQDLNAAYADELAAIASQLSQYEEELFSDIDVDVIEELINFDVSQVTQLAQQYVGDMRSQLMRQVLAGETPDIAAMINNITGSLESNLKTELDTLLAGFSRSVLVGKSKDLGFELFIYLGPDDEVTRPFCERLLDRDPPIYTADEIEEMDNEQGLSVMTYGGGYNCRHEWSPISEEDAIERGYEP